MGAQNIKFAPKFSKMVDFAFFEENFATQKIFRQAPF